MSYITDVVVVLDYIAPDDEARLLAPMEIDPDRRQSFSRIDMNGAGGVKVFCSRVYAGAFNYAPHRDEFVFWLVDVLANASNPVVWMSTEGDHVEVFRPDGIVRGAIAER